MNGVVPLEAAVPDEVQIVAMLPDGTVWAILRRYARSGPGAGSQLSALSEGSAHWTNAAREAQCTVGAKLSRSPIVERVLWLTEAADLIRNIIAPAERSGQDVELALEHPCIIDAAFEFAKRAKHRGWPSYWGFDARACERAAQRLQRNRVYREQWALLVLELSACWADNRAGGAFRGWVEEKT